MNFPTEMFEQAMKQAMINWTNSLTSTANNTVKHVGAHKIVHQFDYHTSQPMVYQHQTLAQTGSYQYYASAPQPMACRQPWLTVQHTQQPIVQHQTLAQTGGYQYYASAPQPMACQQSWSTVQQVQPMTHQQQRLGSCWPQASVLQPSIHHQVQSAIRQ
ncbi:hypothetical protein PVAP13_7NG097967 [Panicum virgatum]|uniref:Uncharacterized protein n=1 Tax=Panicum virgatum TaxID=38727 RepID=A0A8T0PRY6_PANVG|nr:hypothetical protein PVAP13_7NG097967 [Panicum virgatum]